jgi:hypothetical protein
MSFTAMQMWVGSALERLVSDGMLIPPFYFLCVFITACGLNLAALLCVTQGDLILEKALEWGMMQLKL